MCEEGALGAEEAEIEGLRGEVEGRGGAGEAAVEVGRGGRKRLFSSGEFLEGDEDLLPLRKQSVSVSV